MKKLPKTAVSSFAPLQGGRDEGKSSDAFPGSLTPSFCSGDNTCARLAEDGLVEHDGKGLTEQAPGEEGRQLGDSAPALGMVCLQRRGCSAWTLLWVGGGGPGNPSPEKESEGVSHLVVSDSLQPHGLFSSRLFSLAHQALLSMGYPRQEYWSGLPFPFSRGFS